MTATYKTAAEAIEISIRQNEITRCARSESNLTALREQCESNVEADEEEFWGEDENGNEWRVHVPA